jgi:hypothetical protein
MSAQRLSVRQLIAALQDMQAEKFQYVDKAFVLKLCHHLAASPLNDPFGHTEEPQPDAPTGCPHLHTADVGTMQQPGRKLCLDCDAQIP